jgi:hypothetical protein
VTIGGPVTDTDTPTLDELIPYDALFVWGSGTWDGTAFGNVLADYVELGGGVVIAVFGQRDSPLVGVTGRMLTEGYLAYTPAGYDFADVRLGEVIDPGHPIMAGVTSFGGTSVAFHQGTAAPTATLIASLSNGKPLVAVLELPDLDARTSLLGFYPVRLWDTTTNGALLMANSLRWVGCRE